MFFEIRKLPDEPIVIVSGDLPVARAIPMLVSIHRQITRILDTVDGPLYRITDMRAVDDVSMSDILIWLDELRSRSEPGSIHDPRIHTLLVSTHPILQIGVRKIQTELALNVPLFHTLEDALAFARESINGNNPNPDR